MKLALNNLQAHLPLDRAAMHKLVSFLACRAAGKRPIGEITLSIIGHDAMAKMNHQYLARNTTTDVISFSHLPMPGEDPEILAGDILVNAQLALKEGPAHGGKIRELALYIAHGLHHLAGATDSTPAKQRQMRRKELSWLAAANRAGLLAPSILKKHKKTKNRTAQCQR